MTRRSLAEEELAERPAPMAVLAGVTVAGTWYAGEELVLAGVTVKDRTEGGQHPEHPLLAGMSGRRPAWR